MSTVTEQDDGADGVSRRRAAMWILPFFLLGVVNLVLLLGWGMKPLWGFLILPPIVMVTVLGYVAFRTGLASDRTGEPEA